MSDSIFYTLAFIHFCHVVAVLGYLIAPKKEKQEIVNKLRKWAQMTAAKLNRD